VLSRLLALCLLLVITVTACAPPPPDRTLHPGAPLVHYDPMDHPFRGARLAVDPDSEAAKWERRHGATWLRPISRTPQARWVNGPADIGGAERLARDAQRRQRLAVLVAYYLPERGCAPGTGGAPSDEQYRAWVDELARALRGTHTVVILEPDGVAADCFGPRRAALLRGAVARLEAGGQDVYLDAGHSGWRSTGEMAERLLRAGIAHAEGFSVNVSNRQSTRDSYRWGRELSDLLGGREFVIDTSRNGLGAPPAGEWCNVRPQALGERPTTDTGHPGLAALLWVKRPGESDGRCGGEDTYGFSVRQARELVTETAWVPPALRTEAADSARRAADDGQGSLR
jgi:endoglucanase